MKRGYRAGTTFDRCVVIVCAKSSRNHVGNPCRIGIHSLLCLQFLLPWVTSLDGAATVFVVFVFLLSLYPSFVLSIFPVVAVVVVVVVVV